MRLHRALAALFFLAVTIAHAQTYTPKAIRIDAPAGIDTAEPLRIANLKPGELTKQEIESALQRIVDTGLFATVSYTVNSDALVIKLTPSASSQAQPVHFANFVWWQPGELEPLVEARVPLYKGQLPLAGTLTDQVEAALVALMKEKGITAAVESRQSDGSSSITLSLTRPLVVIGKVALPGDLPALQPQTAKVVTRLHGQDFDIAETAATITQSVDDLYLNAGYLDVATAPSTYSPPYRDLHDYAVDLISTVTPNAPYRVSKITIHAAPPLSQSELEKVAEIHPNDVASALALRIAQGELEKAYSDRGFLDAKATIVTSKNTSAHTVAYDATPDPGELYHFAALDTSALPPQQQAAIAAKLHLTPGVPFDQDLRNSLVRALTDLHLLGSVVFNRKADRATHAVTLIVKPSHPAN